MRCGALIRSKVLSYGVVERASHVVSRKIGVPKVYTVAVPYKKRTVRFGKLSVRVIVVGSGTQKYFSTVSTLIMPDSRAP